MEDNDSSKEGYCLVCRLLAENLLPWKLYEDDCAMAGLESCPMAKGHTIVFTKEHYGTLEDMPLDEVADFYKAVAVVAKAVKKATGADRITLLQRDGECVWQHIPHVYVSIIPRFSGDAVKLEFPYRKASDKVQEEVQSLIKEELKKAILAYKRA